MTDIFEGFMNWLDEEFFVREMIPQKKKKCHQLESSFNQFLVLETLFTWLHFTLIEVLMCIYIYIDISVVGKIGFEPCTSLLEIPGGANIYNGSHASVKKGCSSRFIASVKKYSYNLWIWIAIE